MDSNKLTWIPVIKSDVDYQKIWIKLNPLQTKMVPYLNGIATTKDILTALNQMNDEGMTALEKMVDEGWVEWVGQGGAIEDIPEDVIASDDGDDSGLGEIPDELLDDLDFGGTQDLEPDLGKAGLKRPPAGAVKVVRKSRLPSIEGDRIPKFLIDKYVEQDTHSYRFVYGKGKSMIADFYKGNMIKIVQRPLDPTKFLGTLLVKAFKLSLQHLQKAVQARTERGILQGEALIEMGALPPAHIYEMLKKQAEWRILQLINAETVGFKVHEPRVTEPVSVTFEWKAAVFSALWNCRTDDWLMDWASKYEDCIMKKNMVESPGMYGLGGEMQDVLRSLVIDGNKLVSVLDAKKMSPELTYRCVYAFCRIGLVKLLRGDGTEAEPEPEIGYFESEVSSETVPAEQIQAEPVKTVESESTDEQDFFASMPSDDLNAEDDLLDPETSDEFEKMEQVQKDKEDKEEAERLAKIKAEKEKAKKERIEKAARIKKEKEDREKKEEEAKAEFEEGLGAYLVGDWKSAYSYFARADSIMPDQALYRSYKAFVYWAIDKDPNTVKKTVFDLKQAKDLDPELPTPVFLAGRLYKMAGLEDKAFVYFNHVIEMDPDHTEALREIRLYNMAKQKDSGEKKKGLFSKKG